MAYEAGVKTKIIIDIIHDVEQEIRLDLFILIHFNCPEGDKYIGSSTLSHVIVDPKDCKIPNPVITFSNCRKSEHVGGFKCLISTKSGTIYVTRQYKLILKQSLDLRLFPFDQQILSLQLSTYSLELKTWFAPEADVPSGFKSSTDSWMLEDSQVSISPEIWILGYSTSYIETNSGKSEYTHKFGVKRLSRYYLLNIFCVVFFIVQASVSIIAVSPSNFADRANLSFKSFLTMVAFKLVLSNYTPRVAYFTILDYYIMLAVFLIASVIAQSFINNLIFMEDQALQFDLIYGILYTVIWVSVNVYLAIGHYCELFTRPWLLVLATSDQRAKKLSTVGNQLSDSSALEFGHQTGLNKQQNIHSIVPISLPVETFDDKANI